MERISVSMVRGSFDGLPEHELPSGYHFRKFREGEERVWAEIQTRAGSFESIEKALAQFTKEFAEHLDEFESRCIFLVDDTTGQAVGSTTAWYNADFLGEDHGRIHWVAIVPEYQGRKLAKPMLCEAMRRLRESHSRAYLVTHTHCRKAIGMYLDFGFVPVMSLERAEEAWALLADALHRPANESYPPSASR